MIEPKINVGIKKHFYYDGELDGKQLRRAKKEGRLKLDAPKVKRVINKKGRIETTCDTHHEEEFKWFDNKLGNEHFGKGKSGLYSIPGEEYDRIFRR